MDIIAQLERAKEQTLARFGLPDADLERRYGPGKWTVRYVLHHLADSESVFFYRLKRVISEPNQSIMAYDQDAWAKQLNYDRVPLALAKRIYDVTRDGVVYLAREHYGRSGTISFVHSLEGRKTLKDEFDKVVWHNQKHLDQIALALGAR
jgi:hypothetical protein